jgi:hypothetical protein
MTKGKTFSRLFLVASLLLTLGAVSCNKNNDDKKEEDKFTITGNANGAQEVPAVTTSGTGTITATYDAEHNTLEYTITWTGLSGTVNNMHFHGPADPTISAGVQIAITGWPTTPAGTVSGTATLTEAQEADLLSGKWYYNIHTSFKSSGEIRGNLTAVHQ